MGYESFFKNFLDFPGIEFFFAWIWIQIRIVLAYIQISIKVQSATLMYSTVR